MRMKEKIEVQKHSNLVQKQKWK